MRKRLASAILATAGAVAAAVMLSATSALATAPTTWTASPGGSYTSSLASTTATLTDTTAGQSITCTAETDAGTINSSASGSPAVIGTITSSIFSNCTDSLGDPGWGATSSGTWDLNGVHFQATDGTGTTCADNGVTCGTITNVVSNVSGTILGAPCSFTVSGSVGTSSVTESASDLPVTYTNSSGDLFVPNTTTLTVSGVNGCDGIINDNDVAEFTGTFAVSPTQTITGTPAG
ncbi:MAG TPA: hypothetical protein VMG38_15995 [Trebonia sp.]|nr:hypothetical protein [Trebonia sp.]